MSATQPLPTSAAGSTLAPDIRFEGVAVGYGGKAVLRGVEASLPRGRISVILGGSGGGKSTLLKGVLGLVDILEGRILIGGHCLASMTAQELRCVRRRMGVLFQDGALLGSLTLGENVALPLFEHTDLEPELVEEVVRLKLRLVGLEEFIHYYPRQLSGGMRKRAGLARALAMDPTILLCDEPTSGLDPITAAQMDRLLKELNQAFPVTIVIVSHDLESVFAIADHVVVLSEGRVVFEGGLQALQHSDNPYIGHFLRREAPDMPGPAQTSSTQTGSTQAGSTQPGQDGPKIPGPPDCPA